MSKPTFSRKRKGKKVDPYPLGSAGPSKSSSTKRSGRGRPKKAKEAPLPETEELTILKSFTNNVLMFQDVDDVLSGRNEEWLDMEKDEWEEVIAAVDNNDVVVLRSFFDKIMMFQDVGDVLDGKIEEWLDMEQEEWADLIEKLEKAQGGQVKEYYEVHEERDAAEALRRKSDAHGDLEEAIFSRVEVLEDTPSKEDLEVVRNLKSLLNRVTTGKATREDYKEASNLLYIEEEDADVEDVPGVQAAIKWFEEQAGVGGTAVEGPQLGPGRIVISQTFSNRPGGGVMDKRTAKVYAEEIREKVQGRAYVSVVKRENLQEKGWVVRVTPK